MMTRMAIGAALAALASAACEGDGRAGEDAGHVHEDGGPGCATASFAQVDDCAAQGVGTSFPCEGQEHVEDEAELVWDGDPPHSGPHLAQWETQRGEHVEPVARGNWVHNLEHGWIVLLHDCPTECEAELDVLRQVVAARPDERILLTPDPLLGEPRFAAVSWTWVLETDAPELETLLCFVDQHEGQAPEDVP